MIQAIETRYAGRHFRSRLEARWAVFFDHLGIRWEYEYQGYKCSPRLTGVGDAPEIIHQARGWHAVMKPKRTTEIPYLPDFWFPDHQLHGEVKGSLTHPELTRLLDIAASLSSNDGAGCHDSGGNDLIVFGNIPAPDDMRLPTRLHMHKGMLSASGWLPSPKPVRYIYNWGTTESVCGAGDYVAGDFGGDPGIYDGNDPDLIAQMLTGGSWRHECLPVDGYGPLDRALNAARSARFEHGQSGA